jgi:hypothetical protein
MTYTTENPHADGSAAPGARPRYRQPLHRDLPDTSRTHDNWMAARQTSCRQQTAPPQQRCSKDVTAHPHCTARSPSWPSMPGPCLQRAATVWLDQIQQAIRNRMFSEWLLLYAQASWPCLNSRTDMSAMTTNSSRVSACTAVDDLPKDPGRPLCCGSVSGVSLHVCVGLGPVLASHAPSPPAAAAAAGEGWVGFP